MVAGQLPLPTGLAGCCFAIAALQMGARGIDGRLHFSDVSQWTDQPYERGTESKVAKKVSMAMTVLPKSHSRRISDGRLRNCGRRHWGIVVLVEFVCGARRSALGTAGEWGQNST